MLKYIFITGISSGIGRDACRQLAGEGYHVIGTVRKEKDKEQIEAECPKNCTVLICDITKTDELEACVNELEKLLDGKGLYALVNNAGIAVPGPMHMITDEEFFNQMDVNLISTRKVTNRIIPFLEKYAGADRTPRIIFISSISGIFAAPFNGAYCVSKHALECLADIYRRELHYLGIDVVIIEPGPIKTEIWNKVKGRFDRFKKGAFTTIADKADTMISETEKNALEVSDMTTLLSKVLAASKNRNRYLLHKKAWLFRIVAYLIPSKWLDKMIWKNLDKADAKSYRPV